MQRGSAVLTLLVYLHSKPVVGVPVTECQVQGKSPSLGWKVFHCRQGIACGSTDSEVQRRHGTTGTPIWISIKRTSYVKSSVLRSPRIVPTLLPLISGLMVASAESRRLRTSNKEATPDTIPSIQVRGDDREQMHPVNTKILRRATLKIDFYLIPITGMFCVSLISPFTFSQYSCPVQIFCHS